MKRSGPSLCLLAAIFGLGACAAHDTPKSGASPDPAQNPSQVPSPDPDPDSEPELGAPSAVRVVEVTTVTTVQGSSGAFLSPRPSVTPPDYLEPGSAAPQVSFPDASSTADRAKLNTVLLFQTDVPSSARFRLDATLAPTSASDSLPSVEHFFPKLSANATGLRWPLELSTQQSPGESELESDGSSEWAGWRTFPGLRVIEAAQPALATSAATLDYDALGMNPRLLLASNGEQMIVTNRSDEVISNSLLIYAHPGGVGIRLVPELHPGQQVLTTTGPKEGPMSAQLDEARQTLSAFFSQSLGTELGAAIGRAKSVPFLETQGMRLVYLLPNLQIPAQITFSQGIAEHQQVVISQAEVLLQDAEANVLSSLAAHPSLSPASAAALLGRFTQAKLEYAAQNGDAQVSAESSELLSAMAHQSSE